MVVKIYTDCGILYIEDISDFVDIVLSNKCDSSTLSRIAEDLEEKFQYPFTKVLRELTEESKNADSYTI